MPGRDKTGPEGSGPLTGRGMGVGAGQRRGFGRGYGFGRRIRSGFGQGYDISSNENIEGVSKKTLLENEIRVLKDQLTFFEKELSKLKEDEQAT